MKKFLSFFALSLTLITLALLCAGCDFEQAGDAVDSDISYQGNSMITITYYMDENTVYGEDRIKAGTSVTLFDRCATVPGYVVIGWSRIPGNLSAEYALGSTGTFNSDTKLYAVLQSNASVEIPEETLPDVSETLPSGIVVSYDSQGGHSIASQEASPGQPYHLPTMERLGYEFLGWATPDGTILSENAVISIPTDHVLTAQWKLITEVTLSVERTLVSTEISTMTYTNSEELNITSYFDMGAISGMRMSITVTGTAVCEMKCKTRIQLYTGKLKLDPFAESTTVLLEDNETYQLSATGIINVSDLDCLVVQLDAMQNATIDYRNKVSLKDITINVVIYP